MLDVSNSCTFSLSLSLSIYLSIYLSSTWYTHRDLGEDKVKTCELGVAQRERVSRRFR